MSQQFRMSQIISDMEGLSPYRVSGQVIEVRDSSIKAALIGAELGSVCEITRPGQSALRGQVTALVATYAILTPFAAPSGVKCGARVEIVSQGLELNLSEGLLGRTVDAYLDPIDLQPALEGPYQTRAITNATESAMSRPIVQDVFETGIRSIDGMMTLGVGQRIGIFGRPGTGKTSLIGMLARNCEADVVVVCLVGERGREVREFVEDVLPPDMRGRAVVVAATSDKPPFERATCVSSATLVAEYFRDLGKNVFLMVDSLTRTARALREIGLAAGEAPTRRGYPASVYPALPALIERAGRSAAGNITAIYTVLTEGEIEDDPIAEEVKSLTDGHIVLNPDLARRGHYPAIDVQKSLSRTMSQVASKDHIQIATIIRHLMSKYDEIEMLVQVGEYQRGIDLDGDHALDSHGIIQTFLQQETASKTPFDRTVQGMGKMFDE